MYSAKGVVLDPGGSGRLVGERGALLGTLNVPNGAPVVKRRREYNFDASSNDYLGPWAGFSGESSSRTTALEQGKLTTEQKFIRLDQGLDPDGPGKLSGEALTAARQKLEADVRSGEGRSCERSTNLMESTKESVHRKDLLPTVKSPPGIEPLKVEGKKDVAIVLPQKESSGSMAPATDHASERAIERDSCTTTFHGGSMVDYQGRSWMAKPKGVHSDGGDHECFLPKKAGQRFLGHTKGVQSVSFFPGTGHLLLSASMDGKVKVWDCASNEARSAGRRGVRRTYSGHSMGVRQARWSGDGSLFATASFDRCAKVWDTETGVCRDNLEIKGVVYCVTWAPRDDPNVVMIGGGNRKVLQWDLRQKRGGLSTTPSSFSLLEYDNHLGPINTVSFFDEGRRFISTSDDKRLLVWDYGTPVPIKEIQDPSLHAVSAATMHPGGGFMIGQSMDNTLVTYAVGDRIGRALKKTFKGHIVSGYACQPAFSPDGQFLGSGDGDGALWFWQWGSTRIVKTLQKAHTNGPAAGFDWHPLEPSTCVSSGWDGVIQLWE